MAEADQRPRSVRIATSLAYVEVALLVAGPTLQLIVMSAVSESFRVSPLLVALIAGPPILLAVAFLLGARHTRAGTGRTLLLGTSVFAAIVPLSNVATSIARTPTSGSIALALLALVFLALPTIIVWQLMRPATVEWLATHRAQRSWSEARR